MSRHIDKAELISKLQTLEGLSNDERSSLIGLLREHKKKYGQVWEDKPEDVEERLREELPVLREVKDKAILSSEPDASNHILIEGDNLEALTTLSYTHEGKIDVMYFDPPYNTGDKDFIYNDSFIDSEDSYRHSKWLSFMNKRLKLSKKILSDNGVILMSINDIELYNLKILCDSIYGERNFIANVCYKKETIRLFPYIVGGEKIDKIDVDAIHRLCVFQFVVILGFSLYPLLFFPHSSGFFLQLLLASLGTTKHLSYFFMGRTFKSCIFYFHNDKSFVNSAAKLRIISE